MSLRGVMLAAAVPLMAGCGFEEMSAAPAQVSSTVDLIFQYIDQGTFGDTYEVATTAELKAAATQDAYDKLGKAIKEKLGKLLGKQVRSLNVNSMNGVVTAQAEYEAQFEKGTGTIIVVMRKMKGQWLLVNFKVNSPVFLETSPTTPCAKCGKPRPTEASFCPGCGEKVEAPAPAPPVRK